MLPNDNELILIILILMRKALRTTEEILGTEINIKYYIRS